MDRKRGLISFMLVFAFVILSLSLISSTTCSVVPIASCPAVNTVMKLSAQTNAHGEFLNNNYPYALCCFGMTYYTAADNASMHACTPTVSNKILGLSSSTNAHAEIRSLSTYSTNVCFGKMSCSSSITGSCSDPNFPIQVASLSATTNAHLAQYSGYGNVKICCSDESAVCGNSLIEDGETCDCGLDGSCTSSELGGATCASVLGPGYIGTLSCTPPPTGCAYNTAGCCLPETNAQFCTRLGRECGSLTALDNCGTSRTVASCGTCVLPETCQGGTCACIAETDAQFCSRYGRTCGSLTAADNCGTTRTVASCGTCNDASLCTTDTCNIATGCVYTPITCNDGNVCTGDSCNVLVGCVYSPLTGPACTDDGNPCTLDLCSAGSCTHPAISNCCTLNSQCNDNNACTAPDTCNLGTHTCSNPAISSCTNGDGCCPSGCTIGSDNDCTTCTVASQQTDCNDGNACTTQVCSGGLCTNPPIISCTHGDGCCPSGCNAVNDNDCTADCGNGVRENPPELCDGSQLGGATCASLMGALYTGTPSCYPAGHVDQCEYNTTGCIPPCVLTSLFWNYSTPIGSPIVEGRSVLLNITGTNCGGKTVNFEIREKDALGGDDPVTVNPNPITFPSSGTATAGRWNSAEWQTEGWPETDPPEYYFITTISGVTNSSPNSGVNDAGLLRVSELITCGNGAIDGTEQCDNGPSNGVVCVPVYGGSCTYCSGSCTTTTVTGAYCGDTNCDAGNEDCSSCPADCGVCPVTCTILDAYWSVTQALDGDPVRLNVEASNCGGETVTFEVFEDDGGALLDDDITTATPAGTNPPSITFPSSGTLGYVDWNAFYMDDSSGIGSDGDPAELYFMAIIASAGEEEKSNNLNVLNTVACSGYNFCNELPQNLCGVCDVGDNEPTCDETPILDIPFAGCVATPECGCYWDGDLCEPETSLDTTCPSTGNCGNGRLDAGEVCDGGFLQLSDNQCSHFDEYTTGTISCYAAGTPNECTYNFEGCGPQSCGNGVREVGEQCDDWNNVNGDGCNAGCLNENAPYCGDGIVNQANETCDILALQLTDDSCTHFDAYTGGVVDCYADGTPYECTYDFSNCVDQSCGNDVVEDGEECEPPSLNGCDANCMWDSGGTTSYVMGVCQYTTSSPDTCGEGVTSITVTSVGTMNWDASNDYDLSEIPSWGIIGTNFMEDLLTPGVYRYYIQAEYDDCLLTKKQVVQCPATVELPFFGIYQVVLVIAIVGLIYLVYVLRKNDSKKSKSGRKAHKRK